MPRRQRRVGIAFTALMFIIAGTLVWPVFLGLAIYAIGICLIGLAAIVGLLLFVLDDDVSPTAFIGVVVTPVLYFALWALPAEFVPARLPFVPAKQPVLEYQARISAYKNSTFNAAVVVKGNSKMTVGKSTVLEIWICGGELTQLECEKSTDAEILNPKEKIGQATITTRVEIELSTDSADLEGGLLTKQIQPLTSEDPRAQWLCRLTAKKAGTYQVITSVVALSATKNEPIVPVQNFLLTISAKNSHGAIVRAIGSTTKNLITWAVGLLGTLGAAALLIDWRKKKKTASSSGDTATT
jgi:hypothetical protein